MNSAVEIPRVRFADKEVQFAGKLWAERLPIALHDRAQVVMLFPVICDFAIDLASKLVVDRLGISIGADRTERSLPDVELLTGAAVRSQDELVVIGLLHGGAHQSIRIAFFRSWYAAEMALDKVCVLVLVQIRSHVGAKIDYVGARDPGTVVRIGIEDLRGQRFPAARRSAIHAACPALSHGTEFLFDVRDQLLVDSV